MKKSWNALCNIPCKEIAGSIPLNLRDHSTSEVASCTVALYVTGSIYVAAQIFLWFKVFQTSLIFIFLCLEYANESETKNKWGSVEKFQIKEKFEPQHIQGLV